MKLINGDCLEEMDKLTNKSIDCVITDIPYGIDFSDWDVLHNNTNSALGKQNNHMKEKNYKRRGKPINGWSDSDKNIGNEYKQWLDKIFVALYPKMKECSPLLIFSSRRFQHKVAQSMEDAGFIVKDILIWEKDGCHAKAQRINNVLKGRGLNSNEFKNYRLGNLKPMYEPIIYAFKPYQKTITDCFIENKLGAINCKYDKIPSNIFKYKREKGHHPTQKPVALLEELLEIFSYKSQTVLDFTMGSGSTGVACVNTNRDFIGIEIDKEKTKGKNKDQSYFDIAKERIEQAQKIKEQSFFV